MHRHLQGLTQRTRHCQGIHCGPFLEMCSNFFSLIITPTVLIILSGFGLSLNGRGILALFYLRWRWFYFDWQYFFIQLNTFVYLMYILFQRGLLRRDWACPAQAEAGYTELLRESPVMHFWHWLSSQFSYQDWWGRSTAPIDLVKIIAFTKPAICSQSYYNILATYDAELPPQIPNFCNHQMYQIFSAFMKTQWLSWPQLTWATHLDCAMDSWTQRYYLLPASLSSPHPGWRLIALWISQAPQNVFASSLLFMSLMIIY